MTDTSLVLDLLARNKMGPALKGASDDVKGFGGHISTMSIAAGTALGSFAAGGIASVVGGLGDLVKAARDAQAMDRVTQQVIKTTGGAAGVTADQVSSLALAISNKTGIDDDAIHASENLLLTFRHVRNEVGKGNDIFNQATDMATNLSVALGINGTAAAKVLGRALNDPVKGLTMLQRVGISFTADQQKQIKALAGSGHMLEAQKLILGDLGKSFGGTAAAAADPMQKLGTVLENTGKGIAASLLPIIEKFAGFLLTSVVPIINELYPIISVVVDLLLKGLGPAFSAAAGFLKNLISGFEEGNVSMTAAGAIGNALFGIWSAVGPALQSAGQWVTGTLVPAFQSLAAGFMQNVWPAIVNVAGILFHNLQPAFAAIGDLVVKAIIPAAQRLWPLLLQVGKIVGVVAGVILIAASWIIGKLVPAFVWVSEKIAPVVVTVIEKVVGAISSVMDWIGRLGPVWNAIWGGIQTVIQTVWNIIKPILDKVGGAISTIAGGIGKVASVIGSVAGGVGGALGAVGHLFGFAEGGVVPGPKGAPMLAVVHGGERVLSTREQASGTGQGRAAPLIGHLEVKNFHPVTPAQSVTDGLRQAAYLAGVA